MKLSEARGTLVAIGGAEDYEGEMIVQKEFVRLAGGAKARVVIMTIATDDPSEAAKKWKAVYRKLGVDDVKAVDVSARTDVEKESSLEAIRNATGLYFTGGDQLHIPSLIGGTEMQKLIHQRYERGLVIAGSSAGAAMMSNTMIVKGASDETPFKGGVEMAPGMDLLVGAIIDTHFSQRGRFGRLLNAVAHYPQDLGIGIDEDTAMVVKEQQFEVLGSGSVIVIDGGAMSYASLPDVKDGGCLSFHDVRVHVLSSGHKFDLGNRAPVVPDGPVGEGKSSDSRKGNK